MSRLAAVDPAHVTGKTKELFAVVQSKFNSVPNLFRTLANSPAALEGFLNLIGALENSLTPQLRQQIAVAVAEVNTCEYCLSANTAIGQMVGVSADDLHAARHANASTPKADAALKFAQVIARQRGHVTDSDLNRVRQAGYNDAEITEIVATVIVTVFTSYINSVAETEVDFPRVALHA